MNNTPDVQNDNLVLSRSIDLLRFPLMFLVVIIHAYIPVDLLSEATNVHSFHTFLLFEALFSQIIARIAVPCFFFISGFLFFYNLDRFSLNVFLQKIKRRIHSLLVPYLLWNIIVILMYYFLQTFLPSFATGRIPLVKDWSFWNYLQAFWNMNGGDPICFQFWFIRDLMIISLLSPAFYLLNKYTKIIGIVILYILMHKYGFFTNCFYFSLGAYFSINRISPIGLRTQMKIFITLAYVCCTVILLLTGNFGEKSILYNFTLLLGIATAFYISSIFARKHSNFNPSFLNAASFFVYGYHAMVLTLVIKIFLRSFPPRGDLMAIGIYCISIAFVIVFGIGLYKAFYKAFPRLAMLFVGKTIK
jgi:peptidoglycan/LPS O-acetylase OafA/YrhL